jgi:hypothetical protein
MLILSASLAYDYQNTKITNTHEVNINTWSGTFKTALTIADLIVVFFALLGNFFQKPLLYVPFFIIHIQFLCAVAVTTCTLMVFWLGPRKGGDHDLLRNVMIWNASELGFMLMVLYFAYRSYRYLNELEAFLKSTLYLDQI